jgi:hypothetical protein
MAGVFGLTLILGVEAQAQTGCTDVNACNYDETAVTDDGSCAYTGWFIPITPTTGPAVQACVAPLDYYFPDQDCVQSVIDNDTACLINWDFICENAYNTCLGCASPDFYIPYDIGGAPAVEACANLVPENYYLPDQSCVEGVIAADDYCMTNFWDGNCQDALDLCELGCTADWHIPLIVGSGPAVYDCVAPPGYYTPFFQNCIELTISVIETCITDTWTNQCQNNFEFCSEGCIDPVWYVPYSTENFQSAQLSCTDLPGGYFAPNQNCLIQVFIDNPECQSSPWSSACQSELSNCILGCPDGAWHIPYEIGSGGAVFACDPPAGYYTPDQDCIVDPLVSANTALPCQENWSENCQSAYNLCFYGCEDATWHLPVQLNGGPAVYACDRLDGYWTPDAQDCVESVIAADPFCTETSWDIFCQEAFVSCAYPCEDPSWYIPGPAGGAPVFDCSPPADYEEVLSMDCFNAVVSAEGFCLDFDWDAFCQDAYESCASGCTYVFACNYDPTALYDDGSCGEPGCTDPSAENYLPSAACDNGTCVYTSGSSCQGDLDGNSIVNSADLLVFLSAFGNTCPAVGP